MTSKTEGLSCDTVTVLLADKHHQYRDALKRTLELEDDMNVVGEADNWFELEEMVARQHPHIVLMDLDVFDTGVSMPDQGPSQGPSPFVLQQRLGSDRQIASDTNGIGRTMNNCCDTAVIVLTMWNNESTFKSAMSSGARGYVLKEIHSDELLNAIRAVASGESFVKQILTAPVARLDMPLPIRVRSEISTPLTPALIA